MAKAKHKTRAKNQARSGAFHSKPKHHASPAHAPSHDSHSGAKHHGAPSHASHSMHSHLSHGAAKHFSHASSAYARSAEKQLLLTPKQAETFISQDIEAFEEDKKILYPSTAKFYSLPGQLDLVLHGVPFHLIPNQFMRFHAVQATILGWEFAASYILIFFFSLINVLFFRALFLDFLLWLFLTAVIIHSLMSMFYAFQASRGRETRLPLMGGIARRLAED